jgi:hypothetical protein
MQTWSQVSIDSHLYETDSSTVASADYVLTLSSANQFELFTSAHYKQNSADPNTYDVRFQLNSNQIGTLLGQEGLVIDKSEATGADMSFNVFGSTSGPVGALLLKVMATKIFGHPKATAAISNDTYYINNLPDLISSGISTTYDVTLEDVGSASTSGAELDVQNLFEYYVSLGRITSANDVDEWVRMNFEDGDRFTFPFYLRGKLYDDDATTAAGTPPLLAFYEDNKIDPNTGRYRGKDLGKGFISNGNSVASTSLPVPVGCITNNNLVQGEYEVPIRLDFIISM